MTAAGPSRRSFLQSVALFAALGPALRPSSSRAAALARVVVIGGGFGGATAANLIKQLAPHIDVTLVERQAAFVSCPMSNLVYSGSIALDSLRFEFSGLQRRGVRVVQGAAIAIDADRGEVRLYGGQVLPYDKVVVSPGVDFDYQDIPSLQDPAARAGIPHAWRAGEQTTLLKAQLDAMPDGGVFAIHIPTAPYRCLPAPYERVCQIALYFQRNKPRSKIIVLDSNPELTAEKSLFSSAWRDQYKGMIDYRPNSELADIDPATKTVKLVFDDVRADVINLIPPQHAGELARASHLITANKRWCGVNWLSMESVAVKSVHVLGDATLAASAMPKSATMAAQQARVAAAAIVAELTERPLDPAPVMDSACYSFVNAQRAGHVSATHDYDPAIRSMITRKGTAQTAATATEQDAERAWIWARALWAEAFS